MHTWVTVVVLSYKIFNVFQDFSCVAFSKNTSFKSCGVIFGPILSSWLDKLSMHIRNSNGFFTTRLVCRGSDNSYNMTDLLLFLLKWLESFLAFVSADLALFCHMLYTQYMIYIRMCVRLYVLYCTMYQYTSIMHARQCHKLSTHIVA